MRWTTINRPNCGHKRHPGRQLNRNSNMKFPPNTEVNQSPPRAIWSNTIDKALNAKLADTGHSSGESAAQGTRPATRWMSVCSPLFAAVALISAVAIPAQALVTDPPHKDFAFICPAHGNYFSERPAYWSWMINTIFSSSAPLATQSARIGEISWDWQNGYTSTRAAAESFNSRGGKSEIGLNADESNGYTSAKAHFVEAMTALNAQATAGWFWGNEQDIGGYSVSSALTYQQALWDARNQVDSSRQVESCPVAYPGSQWLRDFLNAGATRYATHVGLHAHGSHMAEGSQVTWALQAIQDSASNHGWPLRPVKCTEIGWDYINYGSDHTLLHKARVTWWQMMQCYRFGITQMDVYSISGSLSGRGWDFYDQNTYAPYEYCADVLREGYRIKGLENPGFGTAQSDLRLRGPWILYCHDNDVTNPGEAGRASISTTNGRTGGSLQLNSGGYNRVRQVVHRLTPGKPYTATAWVKGGGTATLKALGYDNLRGLAERASAVTANGTYNQRSVTFTPSNTWVVLSLESDGAGTVYWDDVAITAGSGAQIIANGTYVLTPQCAQNARLDVSSAGSADGTNVQIWGANGSPAQKWLVNHLGNNVYKFDAVCAPGKVLDVSGVGTGDGANVHIWTYWGGENQKWKVTSVGSDWYELEPQHALGKRLDVNGAGTAEGTNVHQWGGNGSAAQRWKFTAAP